MSKKRNLRKQVKNLGKNLENLGRYGLKLDLPKDGDYILGGVTKLGKQVLQEDGQWDAFLPLPEYQALGIETQACTVFGTLSACEMVIKKKYQNEENFSDRWLAWNADITPNGASPHTTAEYLRKGGSPFQDKWDYTESINTWEKFYETPPAHLIDCAKKDFLDRYSFGHEFVPSDVNSIKEALKYSPLGVSVYAWTKKDGDIFYKPSNATENHWVLCYGWAERDGRFLLKIFDSYDNITKMYDGMPTIIKRYELNKKSEKKSLSWLDILLLFFGIKRS